VYISIFYLSNSGIQEFGYYSYIYQYYGSTLTNTVAELIAGLTLSYITGSTFSTIFSIITSAGQLGNIFLEDAFKTNLNNIYQAGNKAIVTVTSTTKSCTTWTNNTYYYENATRNGLIIRSTFREYQNN